jgi:hypothetical protein
MAINNFSNFGLDRKVIYYRPEAERVATSLNKQLVPGAELGPAPRLADTIDVEVVLDHDLGPNRRPKLRRPMGRDSKGLSPSGTAVRASSINRFQTETVSDWDLVML